MAAFDPRLPARLLFGTNAYNAHAQHIALALDEADGLYAWVTSGVDSPRHSAGAALRRAAGLIPGVNRELSRRSIVPINRRRVIPRWSWELLRVAASRAGVGERTVDWIWEHQERSLDRYCARLMDRDSVGGFVGVEHGALAALTAARSAGKPGIVTFMSPHHGAYAKWVEPEYGTFPELATESRGTLAALTPARDRRRDAEASMADWIVTGSSFTTLSLVDAGFPAGKILTVPLAGPEPVPASSLPQRPGARLIVIYAGPVSVRKGAHYLLSAWKQVARKGMELHFYGKMLLPEHVWKAAIAGPSGHSIVFHGSVPSRELSAAYLNASVMVLPTLCDGYGLVVSEALAHGLPVITTTNAGAADAVDPGRTGFVIPPADEEALVEALAWCADHRADLYAMRRIALAQAAERTWPDFRRRFVAEIGRALQTHRARHPRPATDATRTP